MIRVAVLSTIGPELAEIRAALGTQTGFDMRLFTSPEATEHGLREFAPDALVLRFPHFDTTTILRVRRIRSLFPAALILVCTSNATEDTRSLFLREPRAVLLNSSADLPDLPFLILRFHLGDSTSPRFHPRSRRAEKIELLDSQGRIITGRFIDFGRMGAKLHISSGHLRPNDRLLLRYSSSSAEKMRRIEAVVVWSKSEGLVETFFGGRTIGVKFIAYA